LDDHWGMGPTVQAGYLNEDADTEALVQGSLGPTLPEGYTYEPYTDHFLQAGGGAVFEYRITKGLRAYFETVLLGGYNLTEPGKDTRVSGQGAVGLGGRF
jgi:hypothetical protein